MTDKEFEQCMIAMSAGDKDSLRHIYEAYLKLIYAGVYDILGQREEAEDVTAEFFIRLYSLSEKFKPGHGHRRWICAIARNMAVDRFRKINRDAFLERMMDSGKSGDLEEWMVNHMSLKEAMESLNPVEREVVDLKVAGGLTFKDISELLGKPMGTVTWLYSKAIRRLRRCML